MTSGVIFFHLTKISGRSFWVGVGRTTEFLLSLSLFFGFIIVFRVKISNNRA